MTEQAHPWTIPDDAIERLRKDGFFIMPSPISAADLDMIKESLEIGRRYLR
jgi:hypothetical protein